MKLKGVMKVAAVLALATVVGIYSCTSCRYTYFSNDANDFPEIVDRAPLKKLKKDPEHKYVLIRYTDYGRSCDYINDNLLLSANKNVFIITNSRSCYFTTCDSWFEIYEGGVLIDSEIFDSDPEYTFKINYGSLENAFIPIALDDIEKELLN